MYMNGREKNIRVIIAGGGTGGHLFPGVAIAEEFMRRNSETRVLFVGSERGLEARVLGDIGLPLETIDVVGIRGKGIIESARGVWKIPRSMVQSYTIIKNFDPQIVIGVGGYASGHAVDREHTARDATTLNLLIYGGSQGASGINRAVVEGLPYLHDFRDSLRIIHQTGAKDLDVVKDAYAAHGINGEVVPFIYDMASVYGNADLLICRAGATTIAEITVSGKAALLIPFPYAVGDHQTLNARVLVDAGAALMTQEKELSGEKLATVIKDLLSDRGRIREMEETSRRLGNRHAAADIVDECMKLIEETGTTT
jgi:UDP-N-acetylglucosamine--N-acetylmuramyl-(pentapeptide) pyrophosphoryl-undecaprenol N-acetylglucosamine transferase